MYQLYCLNIIIEYIIGTYCVQRDTGARKCAPEYLRRPSARSFLNGCSFCACAVDDEHERTHEKRRRHQKPHGNHQKHHGGHQKHHGDHRQEPHGPHHQEPIGDLDEPETEYLEPLEDFQAIKLGEHQHIGNCTWPQCNNSCPRLQNPITGTYFFFFKFQFEPTTAG